MLGKLKLFIEFVSFSSSIIKKLEKLQLNPEITEDIKEYKSTVINMQTIVIDIQQFVANLQLENSQVKEKLKSAKIECSELKKHSLEENDYEIISLEPQINVTIKKGQISSAQNSVWYCPHCFNKKKKSIINKIKENSHEKHYKCNECNFNFAIKKPLALHAQRYVLLFSFIHLISPSSSRA